MLSNYTRSRNSKEKKQVHKLEEVENQPYYKEHSSTKLMKDAK